MMLKDFEEAIKCMDKGMICESVSITNPNNSVKYKFNEQKRLEFFDGNRWCKSETTLPVHTRRSWRIVKEEKTLSDMIVEVKIDEATSTQGIRVDDVMEVLKKLKKHYNSDDGYFHISQEDARDLFGKDLMD